MNAQPFPGYSALIHMNILDPRAPFVRDGIGTSVPTCMCGISETCGCRVLCNRWCQACRQTWVGRLPLLIALAIEGQGVTAQVVLPNSSPCRLQPNTVDVRCFIPLQARRFRSHLATACCFDVETRFAVESAQRHRPLAGMPTSVPRAPSPHDAGNVPVGEGSF